MRKVLGSLVLASTFVLTACGGGGSSESSGSTNANTNANNNGKKEDTSGNHVACVVQDKTITGVKGKSCLHIKETDKLNIVVDCTVAGEMTIDGNVGAIGMQKAKYLSNSTNLNGYKLSCPA